MESLILVFVKAPEAGQVKTRIGAVLGHEEAERVYRRLVEAVFSRLPAGQRVRVVFTPSEKEDEVRAWLGGLVGHLGEVDYRAQVDGGLGERLEGAFGGAFADGAQSVLAVGTDCVEVGEAEYGEAFGMLASGHDVVFGGANDGGYYLVGLRAMVPEVFRGIPWSSERTFAASFDAACGVGCVVGVLRWLSDVDTAEDWERVRGTL